MYRIPNHFSSKPSYANKFLTELFRTNQRLTEGLLLTAFQVIVQQRHLSEAKPVLV